MAVSNDSSYAAACEQAGRQPDLRALSRPETDDDDDTEKFTSVFVGGAPRSGTTVLHALLCTSEKTNPFIGECSYFSAFMTPFAVGLNTFSQHTRHFFPSKEEFAENHAAVLKYVLKRIWKRVGKPEILILKDPILTASFHYLAALLKSARFIVSVRDPRDTILSRIEVMCRKNAQAGQSANITYKQVEEFCNEYFRSYRAIADNRAVFGERLCMVDYKDVVSGNAAATLEKFGVGKLHPDKIWTEAITDARIPDPHNEWITPLLGQKLSTASVNRYSKVLPPDVVALIVRHCGQLMQELGFPMETAPAA
jgi:hypothetical protein